MIKHSKGDEQECLKDFTESAPIMRAKKIQWWWLILIILGVFALVYIFFSQSFTVVGELKKLGSLPSVVSVAYAQGGNVGMDEKFSPRMVIFGGVFMVLGLVYLAGIFKVFFSSSSHQVETATDLVKTLTGFFVVAATGFLD